MKTPTCINLPGILLGILLALGVAQTSLQAQINTTWSGADDNQWENSGNWSDGVPVDSDYRALFTGAGANRDIELTQARSIFRMNLDSQSGAIYSFSGSQITLNSNATTAANSALRFVDTSAVFDSDIHFAAVPMLTFTSNIADRSDVIEFNGNISSVGTISTFSGVTNSAFDIRIAGNITSAVEFRWSNGVQADVDPHMLTLTGSNSVTQWSVTGGNTALHLRLGSADALASGSTIRTEVGVNRDFRMEAYGADRSYNANLELFSSVGEEIAFVGDHVLTLSGTVDLQRSGTGSNPINVAAARAELIGNWTGDSGRELQKEGEGTLVMGANNTTTHTYGGVTNVNAGTLLVNGQLQSAAGGVEVHNDATLGGIGTIRRNTVIGEAAFLSPGDEGAGTLTFENTDLTLEGTLAMELGGLGAGEYDVFSLTGSGTWSFSDSELTLSLINGFMPDLGNQFTIVSSTQNLGSGFWGSQAAVGAFLFDIDYAGGGGNDIVLTVTVIPEPSSMALLFGLGFGLLLWRGRARLRVLHGHPRR